VEWLDVASNIDHEFFVVRNLRPNFTYHFRLAARNRIGWSEKGIPTPLVRTKEAGMNPICLLHPPPPKKKKNRLIYPYPPKILKILFY